MHNIYLKKRRYYALHCSIWLGWIIYNAFLFAQFDESLHYYENYLAFYLVHILLFYGHAHVAMPCIRKYRLLRYLAPLVLLLEFTLYFSLFIVISLLFGDLYFTWDATSALFMVANTTPFVQPFLGYLIVATLLHFLERSLMGNIIWQGVSLRKTIGLHELINYLFKIYEEVKRGMADAAVSILWLQRYASFLMAKEDEAPRPLAGELQAVRDLLAMEQARHPASFSLYVSVQKGVGSFLIIPMVLLTLVENIRRHGVYLDPDYPAKIDVTVEHHRLKIIARNKLRSKGKKKGHGIALKNLRARLEIHHTGKYHLHYGEKEGFFELHLEVLAK